MTADAHANHPQHNVLGRILLAQDKVRVIVRHGARHDPHTTPKGECRQARCTQTQVSVVGLSQNDYGLVHRQVRGMRHGP